MSILLRPTPKPTAPARIKRAWRLFPRRRPVNYALTDPACRGCIHCRPDRWPMLDRCMRTGTRYCQNERHPGPVMAKLRDQCGRNGRYFEAKEDAS